MKLDELRSTLGYTAWGTINDSTITSAYTSDLLSDVMANAREDGVLITIQAHKNTVAVAALAGLRGIVLCHNRPIPEDMQAAADDEEITLFTTPDDQFTASCRIGALLA